ncbi:MAG: hypothetical protein ACT4PM_09330 [Gemmatimonadales bacterium]
MVEPRLPFPTTSLTPGPGPGWERLAQGLRESFPVGELDRIWAFRVMRRGGQDFGTAILSRIEGDRRRVYTARFVHTVKGKKRGEFSWAVKEVGSGPLEALDELLALVPKRSDEEEPPVPISLEIWFPHSPLPTPRSPVTNPD